MIPLVKSEQRGKRLTYHVMAFKAAKAERSPYAGESPEAELELDLVTATVDIESTVC